jgi:hypothetical protein
MSSHCHVLLECFWHASPHLSSTVAWRGGLQSLDFSRTILPTPPNVLQACWLASLAEVSELMAPNMQPTDRNSRDLHEVMQIQGLSGCTKTVPQRMAEPIMNRWI